MAFLGLYVGRGNSSGAVSGATLRDILPCSVSQSVADLDPFG